MTDAAIFKHKFGESQSGGRVMGTKIEKRKSDIAAAHAIFLRICPTAKADSAADCASSGQRMADALRNGATPIEAAEIEYRFRWKELRDAGRKQQRAAAALAEGQS